MEEQIVKLFESYRNASDYRIEPLPLSGSSRKYYRIQDGEKSYVGVYHENLRENRLFVDFTNHFRGKGLHVPEIYVVSEDGTSYLQEDLGREMLLDVVEKDGLNVRTMELYKKALKEVVRFQVIGHEGLDYSDCLPRPVFDERCVRWDLNYFKYCFLRLAGVDVDEDKLENDFDRLVNVLRKADTNYFMFRDFQSRNIMVLRDEVYFIDYQGGRCGALHYDVASLLYDAIVKMPDFQKEELLDYYIDELARYAPDEAAGFRGLYYPFVLIRLLQAMGAFGLRGLHEGKTHFVDSIVPGLQGIVHLFESGKLGEDYPEIQRTIRMAFKKYFVPSRTEINE